MKYFIIAGERSGDLHGGNLVSELKALDPKADFSGFGGDNMREAGVNLKLHYRELAFMGFFEVVSNLKKIRGYIKQAKQEIQSIQPDAIILIDYGGFNMKIAKFGKQNGIPVHYYITPKVWAWNQKRALKLKKYTDHMYVILPFEKEFFQRYRADSDYVGNPVLDAIKNHIPSAKDLAREDYVALLPGSRKQELKHALPIMKEVAKSHLNYKFAVAQVDNLDPELYKEIDELNNVSLFKGHSYDLLSHAKAAVVTSGTATLETAIWKVPQVVVYKTSWISFKLAKSFIRVPYISLVNLVAEKEVVQELIQGDFSSDKIGLELKKLLEDVNYRKKMLGEYTRINQQLDEGNASANTAKLIFERLKVSNF